MNGKTLIAIMFGIPAIAGIAMYYLQVYAYYEKVPPEDLDISLISAVSGGSEIIPVDDIQAIDSNSSPLRFRACFTTRLSQAELNEAFVIYDDPTPLTAPGWFDCFEAETVGLALENDAAVAYLSQTDIHDGVDRVVAVFPDGRAYAWHQLNEKYAD